MKQDDALAACEELALAYAALTAAMSRALGGHHGLNLTDLLILRAHDRAPSGALRRVDLAQDLRMTPSGVSRAVLPLEKIKILRREPNPADARASLTELTAAGRERLEDATSTAGEVAMQVVGDRLKADELAQLRQLLRRVG
jgi:DNA-binding MarR family transcriptional regulator